MILTTTRIVQTGGEIEVSVSSQIDMKMSIKLEFTKNRGFAEIRKYLDKVYNHIKSIENKSII
jgi:selenocysteine-specific translation elongation factor